MANPNLFGAVERRHKIRRAPEPPKPVDMLLFCPRCDFQHVDKPGPTINWNNPPHKSHLCKFCGWIWRPADVPTNGVEAIKTKSKRDQDPRPWGNGRV